MAYTVPPLPYAYDALEPHIDKATMEFHHDKHHQAYVDKANAALEGTALGRRADRGRAARPLDRSPTTSAAPCKNNGGGHYNHSLFWESMSPDGGGEPGGELGAAIDSAFGSFADFQAKLKETGVNQFGSGWSWLVHDGSGLAVVGSANQDNPISDGKTPLLGVDVWEHAYYLKYQNRRPDYIDAWWNVGRLGQGRRALRRRRLSGAQLRLKRRPATGETASSSSTAAPLGASPPARASTRAPRPALASFSAAAASSAAIRSGVIAVASSFSASHARASAAAVSSRCDASCRPRSSGRSP